MEIFDYKNDRMIPFNKNKMNLYKKELKIIKEMYNIGSEDISYLRVKIDDIDFFNRFRNRQYKFVDVDYCVGYVSFDLREITDEKTEFITVECYNDLDDDTYTFESTFTDLPPNRTDVLDADGLEKFISGKEDYYLEVNFYTLYMFMNVLGALAIKDAVSVLTRMMERDISTDNLKEVQKHLKVALEDEKIEEAKRILEI